MGDESDDNITIYHYSIITVIFDIITISLNSTTVTKIVQIRWKYFPDLNQVCAGFQQERAWKIAFVCNVSLYLSL